MFPLLSGLLFLFVQCVVTGRQQVQHSFCSYPHSPPPPHPFLLVLSPHSSILGSHFQFLSPLPVYHSFVHTAALPPFVSHLLSLCRRDSSHFRPLSLLFLTSVPVFEEVGARGNNGGGTGQVFDNMSSRDKKLQQWEGETQE